MERFKEILRDIFKPKEVPLGPGPCRVFTRGVGERLIWNYRMQKYMDVELPNQVVIEQGGTEKRVFDFWGIEDFDVSDDGHVFAVAAPSVAVFYKDRLHRVDIEGGGRYLSGGSYPDYTSMDKVAVSHSGNYILFGRIQTSAYLKELNILHGVRGAASAPIRITENDVSIVRLKDMQKYIVYSGWPREGRNLWGKIEEWAAKEKEWFIKQFYFSKDDKSVQVVLAGLGDSPDKELNFPIEEEKFGRKESRYRETPAPRAGFTPDQAKAIPTRFYRRD